MEPLESPSPIPRICVHVGVLLASGYQILRFLRSEHHSDVYLAGNFEELPTKLFEVKVFQQSGVCPQLYKSQKRHIKRLASKTLASFQQDGMLYLVVSTPFLGHEHPLATEFPDRTYDSSTTVDSESVDGLAEPTSLQLGPEIISQYSNPDHKNLFMSLEAVLVTTHNAVSGKGLGPSVAACHALEDRLRETRARLRNAIEKMEKTQPASSETCWRLGLWDWVDRNYRHVLHRFGDIQPYEVEVQRVDPSYLKRLEHNRRVEWIRFTSSLSKSLGVSAKEVPHNLVPLYVRPCQVLPMEKTNREEEPEDTTCETGVSTLSLGSTEKQRAKRCRRRERVRQGRQLLPVADTCSASGKGN